MSKLTVESIINIYGSRVKEIKAYNEAKRTKVEEFLQVEPVAFSLSDEPDVLRIYIDKKSTCASLDGELEENEAEAAEEEKTKEYTFTELGFFGERECEAIKEAMQGKTYMNFNVKWSNCAGNCTLIVCTDYEDTESEIKNFFLHCALGQIFEIQRNS